MQCCQLITEMEAENKLYTHMQGDGSGQPPQYPPQYAQTVPQQPGAPHGYPQYPSTIAGSPYYTAPSGAAYGGGYSAPPSQQQQQVTVVASNQPQVVYVPTETYSGAIIYACFVIWCCNWLFGLIAFILASEYTTFLPLSDRLI